ncbi:MAG: uracil phosphoribosyltransferase, partial [Verrucomicrobiales bacterium]|nr:uracil phosphoribosyltransferase [Verrucomicrobiales bacterium]
VTYYERFPRQIEGGTCIVIDPMLATGGSAIDATNKLKKAGATRIRFVALISAPEGVRAFHEAHPEIPIFTAALDDRLNDKAYIVPGLGDAGDRYFGTT